MQNRPPDDVGQRVDAAGRDGKAAAARRRGCCSPIGGANILKVADRKIKRPFRQIGI
jgi:hypothetical protein